jgi:hypothetical protein
MDAQAKKTIRLGDGIPYWDMPNHNKLVALVLQQYYGFWQ